MEDHPNIGLCICKIKVVEFDSYKEIGEQKRVPPLGRDNLFIDLLIGKNVFYSPGGYMVRSSMFRDSMPSMQIQAPREIGQNYQLLLPIASKYPCGYIDDYLYYYTVRKDSHSHIKWTFEEKIHIIKDISFNVLINIVDSLKLPKEKIDGLNRIVKVKCLKKQLNALLEYNRKDYVDSIKLELISLDAYDLYSRFKVAMIKYPIISKFGFCLKKIIHICRGGGVTM